MASTGANVLRWSALGLGIFYGIYHQTTINASDRLAAAKVEYERKAKLIDQAKAEWIKRTRPESVASASNSVITDPEHPNFDLEKFLISKQGDS